MRDLFTRLRARLRTHGGTSETSVAGLVLLGCAVIILVALLCALAQGG